MPSPPDLAALRSLESLVQTAGTLVKQLQDVLIAIRKLPEPSESSSSGPSTLADSHNALTLARDSATLVRAHATKISLLIINEPFTPSAVSTILTELVSGPLPGLAVCVQACDSSLYPVVFKRELAWRCERTLSELYDLLQKIPKDGKVLSGKRKDGFASQDRGSIASTGLLWAACDNVIELANMGVGGFFVQKMNEWKDTLNDIMTELKEWSEEEPDEEDEDEDEDEDDDTASQPDDPADQIGGNNTSTQSMLDDLMNSHQNIPLSDPDGIRPRLESSLRRIRLVVLLYQAITKRRMKKLPPFPPTSPEKKLPQRLDEIANLLEKLPDRFGDLAGAFYELRPREIDDAMDQCFLDAFAASELLGKSWDGSADDFTEWTGKFQLEIKKP
ncbi:hypothetical protein PT974_03763 [Cladobotryum mycophilum]|uniref:Cyclin-D1-binding protein 1-like N-terminal domain-containing protein n=1 Tax=Cladobotryum mycophilum TaxID=491253 RepID=A0ABR0STK2_9HYPO